MTVFNESEKGNRPPPSPRRRFGIGTPGVPWYRDVKVLRVLAQVVFAIGFLGVLGFLWTTLMTNLNASNLSLDWNVFERPFSVAISEGISITEEWNWITDVNGITAVVWIVYVLALIGAGWNAYKQYKANRGWHYPSTITLGAIILLFFVYPPPSLAEALSDLFQTYLYGGSMARAFVTGIGNTLRVVVLSLIACTLLGIFVGIGLLSGNFLVRNVAKVFVEIFRNTPLLVQLVFIYRTMTLILPFPRQSILSPSQIGPITFENNLFAINARGLYLMSLEPTDSFGLLAGFAIAGLIVGWLVRRWRLTVQERTGKPAYGTQMLFVIWIVFIFVGWVLAGNPFTADYPALTGPNITGGTHLTTGFFALFVGLTLYTAAFIAEIVRAGIQSVPHGQIEAARSQGFTRTQVLNLVILPQALRLIIPPLGNQYVNLAKNSSLGLAVNYPDTYRIAQIANNESGQAVPFFVGLMVIYLSFSLILSVLTNLVNRATKMRER